MPRITGAGGITRSLWSMLGMVFGLAAAILPAFSVFDLDTHWWVWLFIVASGAFAGRQTIELWKPDLAGEPADMTAVWRRWKGLGTAWLILAVCSSSLA